MLSLRNVTTSRAAPRPPPRVLIYGPPGLGKTSLAAEFPSPIFIDVECGIPAELDVGTFGAIDGYDAVMEAIGALYNEDHTFGTVVLDTLDRLEPMLWSKVCTENRWDSIEAPGYGKGYVMADRYWRDLLEGLNALRRDRGMAVVLIAHSTIMSFDSPTSAPYSRYDIRLHKRASAIVQDEVDAILFVNQDATIVEEKQGKDVKSRHATGGGTRWIYCEGRPAWCAKNRFGMPDKLRYQKGAGFAALAEFFPVPAAADAEQRAA